MEDNNIQRLFKGLSLDTSPQDQPKDSYRYALNSVLETELGDSNFMGNEESNEIYSKFTHGFVPIGKCYIGNNETILFSVSEDSKISEIGILGDNNNYTVHVNDLLSEEKDKLHFNVSYQIQATYRLRRGCERIIYFTDNYNVPRYYNFDKPQNFKDAGLWRASKFNLISEVRTTPKINTLNVLENYGSLKPGSYTILIQYLDADFNPTQFIELANNINIYNDSFRSKYSSIEGSTNIGNVNDKLGIYAYEKTNKAIKVSIKDLDLNFPYFRLAFVEYTNGDGEASDAKYTESLSTTNPIYIYTGENANIKGDLKEVKLSRLNPGIKKVGHIEQIENRLLLANIEGEQTKLCKLQKYASQIKADAVLKDIILTSVKDEHNPKNPLVRNNGLSFQAGEIYSLGIIYLFDDNTDSPVYHIPGKSPHVNKTWKYSDGANIYPMSNISNMNTTETYVENSSCQEETYWGYDCEGKPLKNTNVRHHRFPTRDDIGIKFVEKKSIGTNISNYKRIQLFLMGDIKKSEENVYTAPIYTLILKYKLNNEQFEIETTIYPDSGTIPNSIDSNLFLASDVVTDIQLVYSISNAQGTITETNIPLTDGLSALQPNGLTYKVLVSDITENENNNIYKAPIFGIKFSNIIIPNTDEIGKKIIGYKIVRQERKDVDKTILDSAVILPMTIHKDFISSSFPAPEYENFESKGEKDLGNKISKDTVQILSPLHKFSNKTFDEFTRIQEVGTYKIASRGHSGFMIGDVLDGTSASGDENKKTRDDDGLTLKHGVRFTEVEYINPPQNRYVVDNSEARFYNLDALNSATHLKEDKVIYNLSCDNRSLILAKNDGKDIRTYKPNEEIFPYVYIVKDNTSFYQNFRNNPYYATNNIVYDITENSCIIFGGDTYISPMRYSTHIYCNLIAGKRIAKINLKKLIGNVLLFIGSLVLTVISGGLGVSASIATALSIAGGIAAVGALANIVVTVLDMKNFNDIYQDKWEKGLANVVLDKFYQRIFINTNMSKVNEQLNYRDDTLKWMGEVIGDFWFETQINTSLRVSPRSAGVVNYLKPLDKILSDRQDIINILCDTGYNGSDFDGAKDYRYYKDGETKGDMGQIENYFLSKITVPDSTRKSGRSYTAISIPIVYMVNNDHNVVKNIKSYFELPLEYDCCSKCGEKFPHRIHYSEQSFQEELTDNYKVFLPNNYRDIEGETGEITNIFRFYNDLFIHTEEALWNLPRNYQERITDQIVSFIGTGSYFEVPPRKIIDDDNGNSAGCAHKWATLKTPHGVFFVSEKEGKIFIFDGRKLTPISDVGLSNWFRENISVKFDRIYKGEKGVKYKNSNNPSNSIGTGFISTYDTEKNRIIFTKKDFIQNNILFNPNYLHCINGSTITVFPNYMNTISQKYSEGWLYSGIENCKMKFYKDVEKIRQEQRTYTENIFKDVDYIVFYYDFTKSGNRDLDTKSQLLYPINLKPVGFQNSDGGHPKYFRWSTDNTGKGLESVLLSIKDLKADYPNLDSIQFLMSAWWWENNCQNCTGNVEIRAVAFKGGTMNISTPSHPQTLPEGEKDFVWFNVGGIKQAEYVFSPAYIGVSSNSNSDAVKVGLFNYNIQRGELSNDGVSGGEIPPETISKTITVDVPYIEREYSYVDGEILSNVSQGDCSWTMSYSLKNKTWTSWHSYLPNFYISTPDKFYSWINNNYYIWKHNIKGNYQTFYNHYYPHIVEYVSINNPLVSKIWNHILLQTEAKKYDVNLKQYYDLRDITFNKMILYNSRQCSGEVDLIVKNASHNNEDYLLSQITNDTSANMSIIDRKERDWFINDFRDIRIDYTKPIWKSDYQSIKDTYFTDKVLNVDTLNTQKDWTQLENFNDKYLAIRLIFNTFADVKLLTNYLTDLVQQSYH